MAATLPPFWLRTSSLAIIETEELAAKKNQMAMQPSGRDLVLHTYKLLGLTLTERPTEGGCYVLLCDDEIVADQGSHKEIDLYMVLADELEHVLKEQGDAKRGKAAESAVGLLAILTGKDTDMAKRRFKYVTTGLVTVLTIDKCQRYFVGVDRDDCAARLLSGLDVKQQGGVKPLWTLDQFDSAPPAANQPMKFIAGFSQACIFTGPGIELYLERTVDCCWPCSLPVSVLCHLHEGLRVSGYHVSKLCLPAYCFNWQTGAAILQMEHELANALAITLSQSGQSYITTATEQGLLPPDSLLEDSTVEGIKRIIIGLHDEKDGNFNLPVAKNVRLIGYNHTSDKERIGDTQEINAKLHVRVVGGRVSRDNDSKALHVALLVLIVGVVVTDGTGPS